MFLEMLSCFVSKYSPLTVIREKNIYVCWYLLFIQIVQFIKDIFEYINSEYYEKLVDEYLAGKIVHLVQGYVDNKKNNKLGSM